LVTETNSHIVRCYDRKSPALMTSSTGVEFASGDGVTSSGYTSGKDGDVDDVIFVEGPRNEERDQHVMRPHTLASDTASTPAWRQFHAVETTITDQLRTQPRTSAEHVGLKDGTSSQPMSTRTVSSDSQPAEVKTADTRSTPRYVALAVNVALLAGIVFVVVLFLAVLVSFLVHRRRLRRRQHNVTSGPSSHVTAPVSRVKPAHDDFYNHAAPISVQPLAPLYASKPRLFVSVSTVGDAKEWFV